MRTLGMSLRQKTLDRTSRKRATQGRRHRRLVRVTLEAGKGIGYTLLNATLVCVPTRAVCSHDRRRLDSVVHPQLRTVGCIQA